MIPRHPALSVELRSEADDLRRYARELLASGDKDGASAIRDQAMHVEAWVDHVVDLEESAAFVAVVLDELDLRDIDKLALAVDTMRAESEGIEELLVELFPPVRHVNGRTITEPAKSATLSTVKDRVETLCEVLEIDPYSGIDAAIAEVKRRVEASRVLEARVDELKEVVTREVRADALDRIAELERDNATLRAELEARPAPSSKACADSALKARKAAWLDEVLDRCPIPRDVTEGVYTLLERDDAEWAERFPLLGSLADALARHVRASSGADVVDDKVPAVDEAQRQEVAREALRAALERHEAARNAKAALTADHPLQLAYEAELEAAYRAAKPKGKVPRLADKPERLDVAKAGEKIPDAVAREITARYGALVKAERDRVMFELASALEDVRRAEAEIAP